MTPNDIYSYAHGVLGWPLRHNCRMHATRQIIVEDINHRKHYLLSGTKAALSGMRFDPDVGLKMIIRIALNSGETVLVPFTEDGLRLGFPFAPEPVIERSQPKVFAVLVRGIKHLTKEIRVTATCDIDAERLALDVVDKPGFEWDESNPEDINIEGCSIEAIES